MLKYFVGIAFVVSQAKADGPTCMNIGKYHQLATTAIKSTAKRLSESAQIRFLTEACSMDIASQDGSFLFSDQDISQWFNESSNQPITDQRAKQILYQWRSKLVSNMVPALIARTYLTSGKTNELMNAVSKDTTNYAIKMARTDIPVGEILKYSSVYSKAALTNSSNIIEFSRFKNSLEKVIVTVLFKSNPTQASVVLKNNDTSLGSTEFRKGLDSDREYTFLVKKDGYEPLEEKRFVAPSPKDQTIEFDLKKIDSK